ncbi:RNA exonuclease 1 homolog isoform X1 [Rissa tridactyla]|uniref:RNA exonuclease 1 homolog isoform X1 n=1 Tax=Rissa tridactyla TaxID=75485 RepID=UPI0023BAFC9B|nr:RNA exonuclease 1 homolog isoform X1 [Rissa tridactyla]
MRPARCFVPSFCSFDGAAGGSRQRPRYRQRALCRGERPSAAAGPSQGVSISSITNEDENTKQQSKPAEVFPCGNQDGNSKMSPFRSRCVTTKRSRSSSQEIIVIKLQESDDECDLVIDVPPQTVNKKPRISRKCISGNRDKKMAAEICAETLHDSAIEEMLGCTEEKSEKIITLQRNGKVLNKSIKLGNVFPKANKIYLPDVNTDTWKVLEERDALAYTKEKHLSSAPSIEAVMQKGILKEGNAETNIFAKAFVQEHSSNEDCLSRQRVTQSVLCTGYLSKDETTIERPYEEIINTEESQSVEENGSNSTPEDTYPYPTYYLNKEESEITLLSSSAEEAEPSGKDTDLSESDDPLEECRRIFEESEREAQKKDSDKQVHGGNIDLSLLETKAPGQKRRIAHVAKFDVHNKNEMEPFKASPWQQGHDAEIQQAHWAAMKFPATVKSGQAFIATASQQQKTMSGLSAIPFQSIGPRASVNLLEVQPIETRSGQLHILLEGNTATAKPCELSVCSVKKTAHVPCKVSTQKKPCVPESGSKVPLGTRQQYVSCFFAECLKTCSTVNEAIHKALVEEQSVYDRCGSKKMYLHFAVKTLKNLRDHGQLSNSILSIGAESIKSEKAFTDGALYELLKDYLLTEEQLNENNFPRPNPEKKGSAILPGVVKTAGYDAFERACCRCGKVYAITSSGQHRRKEECNYHSGRVLEQRVPGGMEKCYSCCEGIVGSAGCQTAKLHVHDGRRNKLEGFMKTLIKSPPLDGNYGVYAVDCEMCYTTHGLELTRVTVVDAKLQVVYDTFVKPDGKVVDYDIRLSAAAEDDLKNTTTSLRDVQAILLNLFSADTILIGHCLENNLFALKLIHGRVVDTSILFPHRLGLPHKRPLASLMADYLRRIRQGDVGGHNSREDAIACMELILWKVKSNNKTRKQ